MKELLHGLVGNRFRGSVRSLSLAVVYEDCDTHEQATAVYEGLVRDLDENTRLTATWWRTSLLNDPKLAKVAARAVSLSDLLLISVHDGAEPSSEFQRWVESWPMEAHRAPALMGLLYGRTDETESDWDRYLQAVARRWDMPYLAGSLASIMQSSSEPGQAEGDGHSVEPYVHWGLNE